MTKSKIELPKWTGPSNLDDRLLEIKGISFKTIEGAECGHEPSKRKLLAALKKIGENTKANRQKYCID